MVHLTLLLSSDAGNHEAADLGLTRIPGQDAQPKRPWFVGR